MALFALVFFSMALTDSFDAAKTVFLIEGRRFFASIADYGMELGEFIWLGVGIESLVKHGVSLQLVWVNIAMFLGGVLGMQIGERSSRGLDIWMRNRKLSHLNAVTGAKDVVVTAETVSVRMRTRIRVLARRAGGRTGI